MVGHHELGPAATMQPPAQPAERRLDAQQVSRGRRAKRHQYVGTNHVDLLVEEWNTGVGFFRLRDTILRRPAFHDVGDVYLLPLEPGRSNHVVEELASTADKGQALSIFIRSRPFPDEHQARVRIAVAKNYFVAAATERASSAVADFMLDQAQRLSTILRRNG